MALAGCRRSLYLLTRRACASSWISLSSLEVKIGISDGTISFATGAIRRQMNRMQFLESAVGRAAHERLANESWRQYHIEPESGLAGTVLFNDELIDRIFLTVSMPSDASNERSVDLELERKAKHDDLLRTELGQPPYCYPWGSVE